MILGDRVRQARELRGLTQTALAEGVGLKQSAIAHIETGRSQPSEDVLGRIALQTGFPVSFFQQGPPPQFSPGSLLFRALRSTTARERAQAQRYGEIIFENVSRMASRVTPLNPLRLPEVAGGVESDFAADLTRTAFGLRPDSPVPNLINLIERSGVTVLALPVRLAKRDAYSLWAGPKLEEPVIVLSNGVPGDRQRFSVAHELGHLVLHRTVRSSIRQLENEADRFAASFLLPRTPMEHDLIPPITLSGLAGLKPRWGVSIQALVKRAFDLGVLKDHEYRYLFEQIGARGWRTLEPVPLAAERPRALGRMAELMYGKPVDPRRMAADWCLSPHLAASIIEAQARDSTTGPTGSSGDSSSNVVDFRLSRTPGTSSPR